jgi:hypothetical protein
MDFLVNQSTVSMVREASHVFIALIRIITTENKAPRIASIFGVPRLNSLNS